MPPLIQRTGGWSRIEGLAPKVRETLRDLYAFPVEGAEWSEAYQKDRWDGRVRLMRKQGDDGLVYPSGLDAELVQLFPDAAVFDKRPTSPSKAFDAWEAPSLRRYQEIAVRRVLSAQGGILRLPIRAGKTLTSAAIAREVKARLLFVVTSDLLAKQAERVLSRTFGPGCRVASYRGGALPQAGEVDAVVATIQALLPAYGTRAFERFATSFGLVVFDECHHLADGEGWRKVALGLRARVKVGLSATVAFRGARRPSDLSSIWLRGVCGPVVASVEMRDLIGAGFLLAPRVQFWSYEPVEKAEAGEPWQTARARLYADPARNLILTEAAEAHAQEGRVVLIDCCRIGHARGLASTLRGKLGARRVQLLLGRTPAPQRQRILEATARREVSVLVSTVLGEGVDLPALEVVVNAEGGRGYGTVIQRLRNLTPDPDNPHKRPIVVDTWDKQDPRLTEASDARLEVYRSEGFDVLRDVQALI